MEKSIKISKLEAAKRQLEIAIRLYFLNAEPVSIHTLTMAAYNIIRDINKKSKGSPMLVKDLLVAYTKPEYRDVVRVKINEAENFFKHADKNSDETLNFNPATSETLLIDVCSKYYQLAGELPPLFKIFQAWYLLNNPEIYNLPNEYKCILQSGRANILSLGKESFFNEILPIVMKM